MKVRIMEDTLGRLRLVARDLGVRGAEQMTSTAQLRRAIKLALESEQRQAERAAELDAWHRRIPGQAGAA